MFKFSFVMNSLLLALILLLAIVPTQAQPTVPSFAGYQNGALVYDDGNGSMTNIAVADYVGHIRWNADGTQFAFVRYTEIPNQNNIGELGIAGVSDTPVEAVILQTRHLAWGYTGSWMRDGRLLFAIENPHPNPVTGLHDRIDLMTVQQGSQPVLLGTFQAIGECGGGSSFPASWRYAMEIGGLDTFRTLADTPYGVLYSTDCAGSQLALMDPVSGESVHFADYMTKAVVSPDGEFVAGVESNYTVNPLIPQLVVYEIATGRSRVIPTEAEPTLVSWSRNNNRLYYSTQAFDRNLLEDLPDDDLTQFNAAYGFELGYVPAYNVAVHHVDLDTQSTSQVYEGDAYVIARITEGEDAVYISQVPNMSRWIEGVRLREIAIDDLRANLAAVQTEVIIVDRTGMGFGGEHFLGYFEQFAPFVH